MTAPVILQYGGDEKLDRCTIPVAAGTQIKVGWFVTLEAATAAIFDAANNDAEFCGIAGTGHEPNFDNRDTITVLERCEVEVDVVSASYVRGAGLKWSAGLGDSLVLVDDGGADTMAWAAETKATTTRLKVLVDVWAMHKLRGENNA